MNDQIGKAAPNQVRHIAIWVCDMCLNGDGGTCHMPVCVFCRRTPPGFHIPREEYQLVPDLLALAVKEPLRLMRNAESETRSLVTALENLANP